MKEKVELPSQDNALPYKAMTFLAVTLAAYGMMRRGSYRVALCFYPKTGGGGINLYKDGNGKSIRCLALDYHPIWKPKKNRNEWDLHYHRGDTPTEIKKHRPQDGW